MLQSCAFRSSLFDLQFGTCNLSSLIIGDLSLSGLGPNSEISNFCSILVMSKDSTLDCYTLALASYLECKLGVGRGVKNQ